MLCNHNPPHVVRNQQRSGPCRRVLRTPLVHPQQQGKVHVGGFRCALHGFVGDVVDLGGNLWDVLVWIDERAELVACTPFSHATQVGVS
jgi:hypothetical protein